MPLSSAFLSAAWFVALYIGQARLWMVGNATLATLQYEPSCREGNTITLSRCEISSAHVAARHTWSGASHTSRFLRLPLTGTLWMQ
jgi:hypothetical protein